MNKPFYYLVLCTDGFKDYMASDRRLGPGVVREIPDSMGVPHRVFGVYPALRRNYDAHQAQFPAACGRES
jgi:hypothetical protein